MPRSPLHTLLLPSLLALATGACTVDALPGGDDDPAAPDGGVDQPDGPAATCAVPAQTGTAAMLNLAAERRNQPGTQGARHIYRLLADLDSATTPDRLVLELWDNAGVFTGAVAPGTYPIAGPETSLDTCGVCAVILGDFTAGAGAQQFYLAQRGSVTIDSITSNFTGSLSNLELAEFDGMTGVLIPGGCATSIAGTSFDTPITIADGGGGGGGGGGGNGGGGG